MQSLSVSPGYFGAVGGNSDPQISQTKQNKWPTTDTIFAPFPLSLLGRLWRLTEEPMSHLELRPSAERISKRTINVDGNIVTVGIVGAQDFDGKDLFLANDGDDLMLSSAGMLAGTTSLWTLTVKPSARTKKEVKARIFANTSKWETWDWSDLVFRPKTDTPTGFRVHRMTPPGKAGKTVDARCWAPVQESLFTDETFRWTGLAGKGSAQYFKLFDDVVPNWFGVVVPEGVTAANKVLLFFHPLPGQAGYDDKTYRSKAGWDGLFHYTTGPLATHFCAAQTGQILIMPVMTEEASRNAGILAANWEAIFSQILGLVAAGPDAGEAAPRAVSSVVVASFSAGITYSAAFRANARLGGKLKGIIDLDGSYSTARVHSSALRPTAACPVVKVHQGQCNPKAIFNLSVQGNYPLYNERWGTPFRETLPKDRKQAGGVIHGHIANTMMFFCSRMVPG